MNLPDTLLDAPAILGNVDIMIGKVEGMAGNGVVEWLGGQVGVVNDIVFVFIVLLSVSLALAVAGEGDREERVDRVIGGRVINALPSVNPLDPNALPSVNPLDPLASPVSDPHELRCFVVTLFWLLLWLLWLWLLWLLLLLLLLRCGALPRRYRSTL